MLMSVSLSPAVSAEAYRAACSRVLDLLSSVSGSSDWECAVSSSLVLIAQLLNTIRSVSPFITSYLYEVGDEKQMAALTALLSLFSCLILSFPSFGRSLLSESRASPHSAPPVLELLCDIVRDYLSPPKPPSRIHNSDVLVLGKETFSLLEALCWNVPEEVAER